MTRLKGEDGADIRRPAEEWEILGELAERLHHFPEAIEAYQNCLRIRFSPKAMKSVLRLYEGQGKVQEMLQSLIRLIAWQYRWYSEVSPIKWSHDNGLEPRADSSTLVLSCFTSGSPQSDRE